MNARAMEVGVSHLAASGWTLRALLAAGLVFAAAGGAMAQGSPAPTGATSAPLGAGSSRQAVPASATSAAPSAAQPQAPPVAPAPAASAKTPAAKPRGGGEQEGIKVHGHWTIVVKNPDGTVTERREFENSLDVGGMFILQNLLAGTMTPGSWAISLGDEASGFTGPCAGASFGTVPNGDFILSGSPATTSNGNCIIVATGGAYRNASGSLISGCGSVSGCFSTLSANPVTFTIAQSAGNPSAGVLPSLSVTQSGFQISGTATASASGRIDTVASLLMTCDGYYSPVFGAASSIPTSIPAPSTSVVDPQTCSTNDNPLASETAFPYALTLVANSWSSPFGTVFSSTVLTGATPTSTPPAPVTVVQNQTIQVTVLFTFN